MIISAIFVIIMFFSVGTIINKILDVAIPTDKNTLDHWEKYGQYYF